MYKYERQLTISIVNLLLYYSWTLNSINCELITLLNVNLFLLIVNWLRY